MKLIVQRVRSSKVTVGNKVIGQINYGYVVLLGVKGNDTEETVKILVEKLLHMRIMPDENDKMNRSIEETKGEILVVPQFTLYADTNKRRPGFTEAANPETAKRLFEFMVSELRKSNLRIETGEFGAKMLVEIINDGPVTIILEN